MSPELTGSTIDRSPEPAAESTDLRDAIRDAIATGEFRPRQRLVEADLSERFRASRGAVRKALLQLSTEGLVERIPHRGARVRPIPAEELREITELRMVVEESCASRAAGLLTPDGAASLVALGDAMRAAVDEGDLLGYTRLDRELHRLLRRLSGQSTMQEVVDRLEGHVARTRFQLILHPRRLHASLAEHLHIAAAVRSGGAQAAASAVREHFQMVLNAMDADVARAR